MNTQDEYFICAIVALLHDLVSEIHGVSTLRGAWARPINQVAGRASAPVDLHRDENGSEALPALRCAPARHACLAVLESDCSAGRH